MSDHRWNERSKQMEDLITKVYLVSGAVLAPLGSFVMAHLVQQ